MSLREASSDAACSSDGTSETTLTEACLPQGVGSETEQAVHIPMLDQQDVKSALPESQVPVASGWTQSYGRFWQEQIHTSDSSKLFGARLIGDAQTPQEFTPLSFSDLACCRYVQCVDCLCGAFTTSWQPPCLTTCPVIWCSLLRFHCCSKWGQNRVSQHPCNNEPLQLILPVFAAPCTVHQAVAGMLSGKVTLSAYNVEAILVLANAVRVS